MPCVHFIQSMFPDRFKIKLHVIHPCSVKKCMQEHPWQMVSQLLLEYSKWQGSSCFRENSKLFRILSMLKVQCIPLNDPRSSFCQDKEETYSFLLRTTLHIFEMLSINSSIFQVENTLDLWWLILRVNLIRLRGAQRTGKTLFLCVSWLPHHPYNSSSFDVPF